MKTQLSESYLKSDRNARYCLKLIDDFNFYLYDPAMDSIKDCCVITFFIGNYNYDYLYASSRSAARRVLSILKKLFPRLSSVSETLSSIDLNCSYIYRVTSYDPSTVLDLSTRLEDNTQDDSEIYRLLHQIKMKLYKQLNRLPNGL